MTQSLKNLSHMVLAEALAGGIWDRQKFKFTIFYSPPAGKVEEVFRRVQTLGLPYHLEWELKAVMLEFGERKYRKLFLEREMQRTQLNYSLNSRPLYIHVALNENNWTSFCQFFPEEHDRQFAVVFCFLLFVPNPRLSGNWREIRKLWTSPQFVPIQSIFLENFDRIFHLFKTILLDQLRQESPGTTAAKDASAILFVWTAFSITMPWFVFDLLDDNQREAFLQLVGTSPMSNDTVLSMFVSIFSRWPWQDKAFNYFRTKENLTFYDWRILNDLLEYKRNLERVKMDKGLFPEDVSFYSKVLRLRSARQQNERKTSGTTD